MTLTKTITDAATGQTITRDMTAEEEAAQLQEWADLAATAPARLAAQLDALVSRLDKGGDIMRAFMLLVMDEFNLHSTRLASVLQAAAQATTLADFKSRMGQINAIPQRTAQQLRTAIRSNLEV